MLKFRIERGFDRDPLAGSIAWSVLFWIVGCTVGCREEGHVGSDASAVANPTGPLQERASTKDVGLPPRYTELVLFIHNHRYGDTNGCGFTFSPSRAFDGASPLSTSFEGAFTCGHAGAISRVTWSYLGSDESGDRYRFVRQYPHGEPNSESTPLDVMFAGEAKVLFEDDVQRIVLRRGPLKAEQSPADSAESDAANPAAASGS